MVTSDVCICICFLYDLLYNSVYFDLQFIKNITYKLDSFDTLANT